MDRRIVDRGIIIEARSLLYDKGTDWLDIPDLEQRHGLMRGTISAAYPTVRQFIDSLYDHTKILENGPARLICDSDSPNRLSFSPVKISGKDAVRVGGIGTDDIWKSRLRLDLQEGEYCPFPEFLLDFYAPVERYDGDEVFTVSAAILDHQWVWRMLNETKTVKRGEFNAVTGDLSKAPVYLSLERLGNAARNNFKALILLLKLGNGFAGSDLYAGNMGFVSNEL
jgi:hypothetical protein